MAEGEDADISPTGDEGEEETSVKSTSSETEDQEDSSDEYATVAEAPCRIHDVIIVGNERTKDWVIERELESARKAEVFKDVVAELEAAAQRLQALEIFSECTLLCDEGPKELPGTANVIVQLKEKDSTSFNIGTYVQGRGESSLEGTVQLRNFLGRAEKFHVDAVYGQDTSNTYSITFDYPRIRGLPALFETRLFRQWRNWQRQSSHTELLRGISFNLGDNEHNIGYELTWRNLHDSSNMASKTIRRQLGHGLVSAAKYTYNIDHRDDLFWPTRGYAFRSVSEIAGLGPDEGLVHYLRQECEGKLTQKITRGLYLNLGASAGVVVPWSWDHPGKWLHRKTCVSDRFFLGGVSSFRGFRGKGVGPHDRRREGPESTPADQPLVPQPENTGWDSVGGDLLLSVTASLSFEPPLRFMRSIGLFGHTFATAGTLLPLAGHKGLPSTQELKDSFRVSTGIGLVFPTRLGRVELNYCHVWRKLEHDQVKKGLHFGLTMSP
eukprot:TRINITY_DN17665_c0_g1_i1.p1 TRINITY_DN17665_c0_g1~~TRINITY_DN17665_c0_g1_i1.p1  ORF type:complete len:504 (-),score=69.59 TRINITY_DN17665_c0_g1_i1:472-1956(-)